MNFKCCVVNLSRRKLLNTINYFGIWWPCSFCKLQRHADLTQHTPDSVFTSNYNEMEISVANKKRNNKKKALTTDHSDHLNHDLSQYKQDTAELVNKWRTSHLLFCWLLQKLLHGCWTAEKSFWKTMVAAWTPAACHKPLLTDHKTQKKFLNFKPQAHWGHYAITFLLS